MVGASLNATPPAIASSHIRLRLPFLDGIRGFAAIFVVLHHVHTELLTRGYLTPGIELLTRIFQLGHYPVGIFIVLSGFSLMLPVAMSRDLRIEGGFWGYLRRRARRILPAYYVVLVAVLLLKLALRAFGGAASHAFANAPSAAAIVSHFGLFHNLLPGWCYEIDPPMWSVATEWQIYFIFPLLLLPLLRRFGAIVTVIFGCALGIAIQWLARSWIGWVCPWYIGLFAMGMAAAMIVRPDRPMPSRPLCASLAIIAFLAALMLISRLPSAIIAGDLLIGFSTTFLLIWCTSSVRISRRPVIIKALEARVAIWLGDISYSLYLVHFPIIAVSSHLLAKVFNLSAMQMTLVLPMVAMPISLGVAQMLRAKVEKGWMMRGRIS